MNPSSVLDARARLSAGPFRLWRRLLVSLGWISVLCALPACAGPSIEAGRSPSVRARPLDPDELAQSTKTGPGAALGPGWHLRAQDARFGGFSGLVVEPERLLLLSDRGWLWSADRDPSEDGLFRSGSWRVQALRSAGRRPDAEELTPAIAGRYWVSLEGDHAIAPLELDRQRTYLDLEPSALPEPLASAPPNLGVEALAALPEGAILAIAEVGSENRHDALVLASEGARLLAYRSAPGFAPTGADWNDGWLFVVERRLSPLSGFTARLTATPVGSAADLPEVIEPAVELLRLSGRGAGYNIEAVSVDRGAAPERFRLWLVSDDNFNVLQDTVLISVDWRPQALARASIRRFSRTNSEGSSASDIERR